MQQPLPELQEHLSVCLIVAAHGNSTIKAGRTSSLKAHVNLAGHEDSDEPDVDLASVEALSPLLSASLGPAPQSLQSQLGSAGYASADAARVGGGLYKLLLQAACTLATDPASRVATLGKAALRAADVELTMLPVAGPGTAYMCDAKVHALVMHCMRLDHTLCLRVVRSDMADFEQC